MCVGVFLYATSLQQKMYKQNDHNIEGKIFSEEFFKKFCSTKKSDEHWAIYNF